MNKIKHVFTDLDGTLFAINKTNNEKITPEISNVMNNLKNHEIELSIATGRDYSNAKEIIELNGITNYKYIIGCNGSQIYDKENNQLIYVRNFSDDEFNYFFKAYDYLREKYQFQFFIHCYTLGKTFTHVSFLIEDNFPNFLVGEINDFYNSSTKEGKTILHRKSYTRELCKKAFKISIDFVSKNISQETREQMVNDLRKHFPHLTYSQPLNSSIEVTPLNITKSSAINYINDKYLKLKNEEIIVFGDGGNDLTMLEEFNSYTRITAPEIVKKYAKHVIDKPASEFVAYTMIDIIKN